jgi:hypothetical protein
MEQMDTFAVRLDRRLEEAQAALAARVHDDGRVRCNSGRGATGTARSRCTRTVRRATLAATVLFASGCAAPVLYTGGYESGGAAAAGEPMYQRYLPARLLAQAAALELTAEQVAALGALRDSAQAGGLTPLDAAQSARGVLRPTQRRAVEADPRRPVSPTPPPAPPHRH